LLGEELSESHTPFLECNSTMRFDGALQRSGDWECPA